MTPVFKIALLLLLCFPPARADKRAAAPSAGDIEARRGELEEIKREIEENRKEIGKLENKEADLATRLQKIDDNIAMMDNYIRKLNDQELALEKDMDSIKTDLSRTGVGLARRKAMLRKRVRSIYIRGRYDPLDVVFSARSFSDFIRRYTFFRYLADNDQRLISSVFEEQRSIEKSRDKLEERIADIQSVMAEKNSEQKKLSDQRKAREKILQQVKGRKDTYLKLTEDLEKRKEEINTIIEALEEARRRSIQTTRKDRLADFGDFGKLKGRLPWPVQGKVIRKFGKNMHPVYKTITINNGIDIGVQPGVAIQSVASGEVLYTGSMSSFGNFVIIGHSNGFYTLYANLSFIGVKKGDKVETGGSLGLSGDSGSLEGSKLHFEIRQQRQIFNPSEWLKKEGMMQSPYLISENQPFRVLDKAVESGKMHHAYLLSGPEGAGKMAMALHFALKLLCRGNKERPCLSCASCRKVREYCHPDFRIIFPFVSAESFKTVAKELDLKAKHAEGGEEPGIEELYYRYLADCARDLLLRPFGRPRLAAEFEEKNREISVQQVRDLIEEVQMPPSESPFKVVIFSEADRMAPVVANTFLKTLEEPNSYVKFFLITSKPRFLLQTIRSRCQEIKFTGLKDEEIRTFLMEREKAPAAQAALAARFSLGSLPNALEFLDPENSGLINDALSILEWFVERNPRRALDLSARFAESSFLQSVRRLRFTALLMHEACRPAEKGAVAGDDGLFARLNELSAKLPPDLFSQAYDRLMAASAAIERKSNSALVHSALLLSFVPA